ncbi:Alpha-D-kanosaminyltransferase [Novipirellula aureliae]|uniref:Alpha-D-kanosaminyltransferase n=1 Tax=Novipirellula aureliae TaxID=2527966 RepID=A0A5C6DUG8_9BACT|nr:glycosyltransferase [Novipirellula aureliae]TWU40358.1 Alpha-D-kanosaminyltransferase [Novipirellula aureliae]
MRIAFVITELNPGGAERCLTELAIGMTQSDDDVRVFSIGPRPEDQHGVLVDRMAEHGIAPEYLGAGSVWQFAKARKQLRDALRLFAPTIVQTFLFHANVLGTLAAKEAGIATRVGGLRVAEVNPIRYRMERRCVKQMRKVVCVSDEVKQFAMKYLASGAEQTIVIPNAVNTTRFSTALSFPWSSIGWPDDSIVSLFVGRMHPQKGLELIQQQIDRLAPAGSKRRVLLVGDGPLAKKIDRWIDLQGGRRVKRLPYQRDIAPLMKAARVLILPSHFEGMPNVVLEMMAAGRPVVSSRVEGSGELLSHQAEMQLFAPHDSEAMAFAAERFLTNPQLSDEIGLQNQTRVRNDFSILTMVDRYRSLYRSLLERSG